MKSTNYIQLLTSLTENRKLEQNEPYTPIGVIYCYFYRFVSKAPFSLFSLLVPFPSSVHTSIDSC